MKKHKYIFALSVLLAANFSMAAEASAATDEQGSVQQPGGMADKAKEYKKILAEADALMKEHKPAEAYKLLEPFEFERSGEVRYDYLLGISALDSGKADKATLALERVLAVDPNFAGARLDMARAYYQLGDLPRAKTEFETVLKQNPPEAARTVILKYLDAIVAYQKSKNTQITGYIEGSVGHDSNVNSGTGSSISVATLNTGLATLITALTGIQNPQIPPSKRSGNYFGVAEGVDITHKLGGNWSILGGADLKVHDSTSQAGLDLYNYSNVNGRVGAMYASGNNAYKLTLSDGQLYSGKTMRTDMLGLAAEWQHMVNGENQASVFAQYGQNRAYGYQPTGSSADVGTASDARVEGNTDQLAAGLGWARIMDGGKKILFGSLSFGNEFDVAPALGQFKYTPAGTAYLTSGRPDGKKRFGSLRIAGQMPLTGKIDGFAALSWTNSSYAGASIYVPLNGAYGNRKDNQYDLALGANWHLDQAWTVKPQLGYTRKNSNVALYSFDRADASLTIRRDFR